MSSHCSRYPNCGCPEYVGIHCKLKDGDEGTTEILQAAYEDMQARKQKAADDEWRQMRGAVSGRMPSARKPHHKHASNYTPPKKKRRK